MIYCMLKGGLGNMMFQIAATTSLSIEKNTAPSFPNLNSHLEYLNSEFVFNAKLDYAQEYKELPIFKNLNTIPYHSDQHEIITFPFHYEEKNISDNSVIEGFFQSEKYFIKNKEYILKLFSIDENLNEELAFKYSDILKYNTTSIHVRRGDYLQFNNHHPCQSLAYYQKGIDHTKDYTEKYLIFSDDIEWCKTKFLGNRFIFVNEDRDFKEMYLMSLCNNNITCNSSFSWWSAWLNKNPNKIVIAPKIWFGPLINENDKDIIPESWIKI
jgi:hypothetical protein